MLQSAVLNNSKFMHIKKGKLEKETIVDLLVVAVVGGVSFLVVGTTVAFP